MLTDDIAAAFRIALPNFSVVQTAVNALRFPGGFSVCTASTFNALSALGRPVTRLPALRRREALDVVVDVEVLDARERELTTWEIQKVRWLIKDAERRRRRKSACEVVEIESEVVGHSGNCIAGKDQAVGPASTSRVLKKLPDEKTLEALRLLQIIGKGKYRSGKWERLVLEMMRRADVGEIAKTFEEEKAALRQWLRTCPRPPKPVGDRKYEGQLFAPSTLDKIIISLEPIYQTLRGSASGKFAAN